MYGHNFIILTDLLFRNYLNDNHYLCSRKENIFAKLVSNTFRYVNFFLEIKLL